MRWNRQFAQATIRVRFQLYTNRRLVKLRLNLIVRHHNNHRADEPT